MILHCHCLGGGGVNKSGLAAAPTDKNSKRPRVQYSTLPYSTVESSKAAGMILAVATQSGVGHWHFTCFPSVLESGRCWRRTNGQPDGKEVQRPKTNHRLKIRRNEFCALLYANNEPYRTVLPKEAAL